MTRWTDAKNARRCALIDKDINGELTDAESSELEALQSQMLEHRRRVAPLPFEELRSMLARWSHRVARLRRHSRRFESLGCQIQKLHDDVDQHIRRRP
jgi:hypothetical protein